MPEYISVSLSKIDWEGVVETVTKCALSVGVIFAAMLFTKWMGIWS